MTNTNNIRFSAPCHFGLEKVLRFEVTRIGGENITVQDGRVSWTGDFNTFKGTDTWHYIRKHWLVANDLDPGTPSCTCSMSGEDQQIDFICAYPKESFEVNSFKVFPDRQASDHNPVAAELVLKES